MSRRTTPSPERIAAVIGLGQMGRGIALNLDRKEWLAACSDVKPIDLNGFSSNAAFLHHALS